MWRTHKLHTERNRNTPTVDETQDFLGGDITTHSATLPVENKRGKTDTGAMQDTKRSQTYS